MVNHSEVNISHRKKHGVWFKWCLQTNQKPMKYYNEKYRGEEERSFPKLSDVWLHRSPCDTGTSIHSLYKTILTISNSMVPANWEKSHDLLSLSTLTFYFLLQTYTKEIYGGECRRDCIQAGLNTFGPRVPQFFWCFSTLKNWDLALQNIFWSLGCVKNDENVKIVKNQVFKGIVAISP